MLIVDVDFNVIRMINRGDMTRFFYIDYQNRVEVFTLMNGIMYRYVYRKTGTEEQDRLFMENNLMNALQINGFEYINEVPWRELFLKINSNLEEIKESLNRRGENQ